MEVFFVFDRLMIFGFLLWLLRWRRYNLMRWLMWMVFGLCLWLFMLYLLTYNNWLMMHNCSVLLLICMEEGSHSY